MNRVFFYLTIFALLPLLFLIMHHISAAHHLNQIRCEIATLYRRAAKREKKQFINRSAYKKYFNVNRFYLDKLEQYQFCKSEIESLSELLKELPSKKMIERLRFLQDYNHLVFDEHDLATDAKMKESTLTLTRPIEVNTDDLRLLLTQIEQAEDAPQLLITNFHLERSERNFLLNLTLLKREYL